MADNDAFEQTKPFPVTCWREGQDSTSQRKVVIEEPLEIFVDGQAAGTLMRTPGRELALAAGFCLTEGLVEKRGHFGSLGYCRSIESNRIDIKRSDAGHLPLPTTRVMTGRTSCGICGRVIIDELSPPPQPLPEGPSFTPSLLTVLAQELRKGQELFRQTGGTHAAALARTNGTLLSLSEDVGRHNALDKAIGTLFLEDRLDEATMGCLSSRLSYEMVLKALRARLSILCGLSAPTALAISLAERFNLTLVGFLRGQAMTVYTGFERLSTT